MNKKLSALLSASASIAACASLIAGSTFALFTSESKTNIAITAGKVAVSATIDQTSLNLWSFEDEAGSGEFVSTEQTDTDTEGNKLFALGGTASFEEDGTLTLANIVPGDRAEFTVDLANESTVSVKYQIMVTVSEDTGLYKALEVEVGGEEFVNSALSPMKLSKWKSLEAKEAIPALSMSVELPYTYDDKIVDGNEEGSVQNTSCTLTVAVQAVQANAQTTDPVAVDLETADILPVYSANEFKTFRDSVNEGETYAGKTVELFEDLDLAGESWAPIGTSSVPFLGSFDGQNHTVSNLKVDSSTADVGLFGYMNTTNTTGMQTVTLKNLTVNNATVKGTTEAAAFVGRSPNTNSGRLTLENLKLTGHVEITSGSYAGGIVGRGLSVETMRDIVVDVDATSFVQVTETNRAGGIIGSAASAKEYEYENLRSNIEVRGGYEVGGIVGSTGGSSNWNNCVCTGKIVKNIECASPDVFTHPAYLVGGIAGNAKSGDVFMDCHYTGEIVIETGEDAQLNLHYYGFVGAEWGNTDHFTVQSCSVERTFNGTKRHIEWDEAGTPKLLPASH